MPIELIPDGTSVQNGKINEIIAAVNAQQAAYTDTQVAVAWLKYNPATGTVLGKSTRITSVDNFGGAIKVTFDPAFESADDYSATCTCTNVSGNAAGGGFAQIDAQTAEYVQFSFNSDDGDGGTPSIANVNVMWNIDQPI